jgi:lysophospholipid acyltransferase (LPLAT)-like uncharacterized protein
MIKSIFRAPLVQDGLARVFAAYLSLALKTIRWREADRGRAEVVWDGKGGVLVCFWHARIALSPACWPLDCAQEPRALISLSPDGQFIAGAVARLGFPAIRGSGARDADGGRAKGGAGAFRDVLRWLRGGGGVAVTPDGPRGPAEEMGQGMPLLAKASGASVLLVGLASKPCLRLKSWDRAVLPLPFTRGAIVWVRAEAPPRDADDAVLTRLSEAWAEALRGATQKAEAMAAE